MPELALDPDECEIALSETRAVLEAATSPEYREKLTALETALEQGSLEEEHAERLEPIIELALQAGRARAVYGPPGEQAALKLYRRLPRGAALAQSAREVSRALETLNGRRLEGTTLTATGPGAYTLSIATEDAHISVRLDRQGARLATVEV